MRYISEKEYSAKLKRIEIDNRQHELRQKLKTEQNKYKHKFKLPSTSKLIATYLFIVLNIVLTFSMVAMWTFQDLTYLGVLVTDVAAQVLTYFIYTLKAKAENTVGGITYDMALKNEETTPVG